MKKRIAKKILYNKRQIWSLEERLVASRHIAKHLPKMFGANKKYVCMHCKSKCPIGQFVNSYCLKAYKKFLCSKGFNKLYCYAGAFYTWYQIKLYIFSKMP